MFNVVNVNTDEWMDEEIGTEAVQKILDSLDDIVALQDPCVDINVLMSMLTDSRLHSLLQVQFYFRIIRLHN